MVVIDWARREQTIFRTCSGVSGGREGSLDLDAAAGGGVDGRSVITGFRQGYCVMIMHKFFAAAGNVL